MSDPCRLCGVAVKLHEDGLTPTVCDDCLNLDHFHRTQLEILAEIRDVLGSLVGVGDLLRTKLMDDYRANRDRG